MVVASVLSAGALLGGGIGVGHALAGAQTGAGTARLGSQTSTQANHASFAVVRTTPSPHGSGNGSSGRGASGGHHCPNHSGS
jgi:hypothetical protein